MKELNRVRSFTTVRPTQLEVAAQIEKANANTKVGYLKMVHPKIIT